MSEFQTIVVGAGHAGLGVSRELRERGVDHVVLERGRVGESWRSQRWASFHLNTSNRMNRLPGGEPAREPDAFPTAGAFAASLAQYASVLPVHEGVAVTALERDASTGWFEAVTSAGTLRARTVVVASGAQRVPRVPRMPAAALPRAIHQIHAAAYRLPDALDGGVLVVGGAQTGLQIAEDLADAGQRVFLATSRVGRMPRRYRGRDTAAWLVAAGVYDQTSADVPPHERAAPQPQVSGTRGGHTLSHRLLAEKGVVLLGRLADVDGRRLSFAGDLAINAWHADTASWRLRRRIDAYIAAAGLDAPPEAPDAADVPLAPERLRRAPLELDLQAAGIGTIVWATGFAPDTAWLRVPVLDREGRIVHRDGSTAVPGLFAAGLPWLRTRGSGIVYGVAADAPHVAGLVARQLGLGGAAPADTRLAS